MQLSETQVWLEAIFRRQLSWREVGFGDGDSFTVTSFPLSDDGGAVEPFSPTVGGGSGRHAAPAVGGGRTGVVTVAATADAARVPSGVVAADGLDIRVEFIVAGYEPAGKLEHLVAAAADVLARGGDYVAHPGRVFPRVGAMVDASWTTPHALLVEPFLWAEGVPQYREQGRGFVDVALPGVAAGGPEVEWSDPGRLTVPVQLVMLTEAEFVLAVTQGVDALHEELVLHDVDFQDFRRASAV